MKPRRVIGSVDVAELDVVMSREERHTDPLAETVYDRLGAEVRGLGEVLCTYMETLTETGTFNRMEAFSLVETFACQFVAAEMHGRH